MRIFEHPNLQGFVCPICGTSIDKPVVLIGVDGTENGGNIESKQFHLDCIDPLYYKKVTTDEDGTEYSYLGMKFIDRGVSKDEGKKTDN